MTATVSVVIATRNRRASLARALASVDAQRFRDLEVIAVDDASTDGTSPWLRAIHPAVNVVTLATASGAAAARNRGVERARGEIMAFLDDDDTWRPAYLEAQMAQFARHSDVVLCSTGHVEVDRAGQVFRPDWPPLFDYADPRVRLLAECPIHTLSVVACRREAFVRDTPFDESLAVVHDLDWYVRLTAAGGCLRHIADVLVERSMPGGLVTRHRVWRAEERAAQRRWFKQLSIAPRDQRRVRAARCLFFAKLGLARGDITFAVARLAEGILASPVDGFRIAVRRLLDRRRRGAAAWNAAAWEGRS